MLWNFSSKNVTVNFFVGKQGTFGRIGNVELVDFKHLTIFEQKIRPPFQLFRARI